MCANLESLISLIEQLYIVIKTKITTVHLKIVLMFENKDASSPSGPAFICSALRLCFMVVYMKNINNITFFLEIYLVIPTDK